MEHVGVGFDWNLGYEIKKIKALEKYDIETNPKLWGFIKRNKEINIKSNNLLK